MFAYDSSEEHLKEIKEVLAAYFARKVDDDMDVLYNEGKIDADVIEAWGNEHMRTPYKWENETISTILNCPNIRLITPYYRFGLISSDADDNKFVDCAITSGADYIVTNDAHFDVLEHIPFPKVSTLSIKDFSEELYTSNTSGVSSTLLNEERIPYTTKKALK